MELRKLLREAELYWLQRSKATRLLQGDNNTKYFLLLANGRHRKTKIYQLEQDEGIVIGDDNLKDYITNYYKNLFREPMHNDFSLQEERREDIPQISHLENEILCAPFSEQEVKKAVFEMEHNKALGPDGFLAEFYQFFWETIKGDLMQLFYNFHQGILPIHSLNFGVITLLPKKADASRIQQFRPICLLNVSFKIFTKVLTNRLSLVANKVIRPSQTAFIPGRHILEGVVILHETLHEMHRKKNSGVILKLDFEKAYDKVKWPFLQQVLRMKGFSPTWYDWINQVTTKGTVGIKVNEDIGHYFQTIFENMLWWICWQSSLVEQKKMDRHQGWFHIWWMTGSPFYDMQENNLDQAVNMKILLCAFEQLSGLKINFHKIELFCFGEAKNQ